MFKIYLDGKTTLGGIAYTTAEEAQKVLDAEVKKYEAKAKQAPEFKKKLLDLKRCQVKSV
jgi:hypothetical protein